MGISHMCDNINTPNHEGSQRLERGVYKLWSSFRPRIQLHRFEVLYPPQAVHQHACPVVPLLQSLHQPMPPRITQLGSRVYHDALPLRHWRDTPSYVT